jgi:hypothetical protein
MSTSKPGEEVKASMDSVREAQPLSIARKAVEDEDELGVEERSERQRQEEAQRLAEARVWREASGDEPIVA